MASCSVLRVSFVSALLRILFAFALATVDGVTPWAGLIVPVVPGTICPVGCAGVDGVGAGDAGVDTGAGAVCAVARERIEAKTVATTRKNLTKGTFVTGFSFRGYPKERASRPAYLKAEAATLPSLTPT